MDVQSVSKAQKTSLFTNVNTNAPAPGDSGSTENAFSALLNLAGVKFNTGSTLGGLESKLMHSNDAAHAVQAEARDDASQNAPRTVAKAKSAKSDDKDAKPAKDDDNADTDATASTTDSANTTDAAADQTQTAVQAAVAATVALPIVAQTQAAPVAAVVQQAAATEAVTDPVEAVVQTAAAAVDANVAAAATVTTPEQVAAVAPVIQKAAGPVAEQTKAADAGPKTFQATATAAAATDTSTDVDATTANLNTVTSAKAATAKTDTAGPKETRSAAAVDQSQNMSRMLGDDNKIQVQVHVGGKVAAQTFGDANPYNIYSGYTGAAAGSTANGQVGDANATNALVQTAKTPTEAQTPVAPVMLPPQLQSQQTSAPTAAARPDAGAPIRALESAGSSQNNSQNDAGFESFGGHAQNASATGETKAASSTATDRPQVTPQQIVDQIKVVITRAAKAGLDKVTIQLKPLELGRIDVKLEMSADHKVSVTVTADNKETLALLQSDSKTLENTLNDAGLRTDSANLHFNLRSESDAREAEQNAAGQNGKNGGGNTADINADLDALEFDYAAAARTRGGVDTFA